MASAEWTMKFSVEQTGTTSHCIGVVLKHGKALCHLSMVSEALDPVKVHEEIAEKARAWIAEYQTRRGASQ